MLSWNLNDRTWFHGAGPGDTDKVIRMARSAAITTSLSSRASLTTSPEYQMRPVVNLGPEDEGRSVYR